MSRLCRTIRNERYLLAGTLAGRQGLFMDSNTLPGPMLERLAGSAGAIGRTSGAVSVSARSKELILRILKKTGECGEGEIREFVQMHPGLRSLRYRNYESSLLTEGQWKKELGRLVALGKRLASGFERADLIADEIYSARTRFGSLCFDLGLDAPSRDEMMEALMAGGELSKSQSAFFRKAAAEDGPLREELEDLRAWASNLRAEELNSAWRKGIPSLMTAASLAHKLRFCPAQLSEDEKSLIGRIFKQPDISPRELERLEYSFSSDVSLHGDLLQTITEFAGNKPDPILHAARASSEFDTLLDFLGVPRPNVHANISKAPGLTKPHSDLTANHPDNDDALTSVSLAIPAPGGMRHVELDIVFDGVSGHGGASIASRIAKDTFEIASLAGWIRSPEDVRMITLLADLAIDIEKERLCIHNMGTTMAASFVEGNMFHGIHCGDSDYVVVRGGNVVLRSTPHGQGNVIWSGLGIGTRAIQVNNSDADFQPLELLDGDAVLTMTDGISDVLCDHEYGLLASRSPGDGGSLAAAVAGAADFRMDPYSSYAPGCGCAEIAGKDDDKALIARYVGVSKKSGA